MIIFYCLDIETNGILNIHEICEVSVIRTTDLVQITRQVKVDRPQDSSLDALAITGKTLEDLRKGISKTDLVEDLEEFFMSDDATPDHRCIVGHNISFDRRFLWNHWTALGQVFPANLYLDTMAMMRKIAKKRQLVKPKLTLQASCEMMQTKTAGKWHSAKYDIQNNYFLWKKLMDEVDHLDFIKTIPHAVKEVEQEEDENPNSYE